MAAKDELTEAVKHWDKLTAKRAKANREAKLISAETAEAKQEVDRLLGERGHEGVRVGGSVVSVYEKTHYYVREDGREAFERWAKKQDEQYLEPVQRVREETLNSNMQMLEEDGQPLPPGVSKYTERKISKRKA